MLDVHQLNVFLAAAETLNFTNAAKRLHMTQPSVSQHIQGLERHFELQLFVRNGRNLELTDAGLALVPLARDAVRLSIQIDETMVSLQGQIYGHLNFACSTTPGKYILPHVLAKFHHHYPQVRVTCNVMPQGSALKSLLEGESHFALFSLLDAYHPDIEVESYLTDSIVLIAPLDHPWATAGEIGLNSLMDGDYIQREPTSGTYSAVREALAQRDISTSDLRILITLGSSEAIVLAVREGLGVAFVSRMVVERICPDGVAQVHVRDLEIQREIFVGRNSRRPAGGAQAAFWNFLIDRPLPVLEAEA